VAHLPQGLFVLFTVSAIAVVLPTTAYGASGHTSGKSMLSKIRMAIGEERGVHLTLTSGSGSTPTKIVADIGKSQGTETITTGSNRVTIRLDASYAYVGGNAGGLTSIMGLTKAEQRKVGSDFISAKAGTTPYKALIPNVTMKFVTNFLPSLTGATYTTKTIKGSGNYELVWTKPATASTLKETDVLVVSGRKNRLPVSETVTTSSGTASAKFTQWGDRISVPIPPTSSVITYADVIAS
jgi:hypothetical protein